MNIVIKGGSASLTQFNSNLTYYLSDIKVYSETDKPAIAFISSQGFKYNCSLSDEPIDTQGTFKGYALSVDTMMPEDSYIVEVSMAEKTFVVSSTIHLKVQPEEGSMFDEHNCLLVFDRIIQVVANQVHLLAEDENSQEIRFKIRNRYDGINFLNDSSKQVEVDFIPADWETIKQETEIDPSVEFIASRIVPDMIYPDPQNPDYMIVRWLVPLAATQKAGNLKIALAITDGDEQNYVWQTTVANLLIQPNIGRRNTYATTDLESPITKIANRVEALEQIFNGVEVVTLEEGESIS